MAQTLSFKATDQRDRILALLKFALFKGSRFLADYNLETPIDISRKRTSFCLLEKQSPMILSLACVETSWSSKLPSWIPDLSLLSSEGSPPQSFVHRMEALNLISPDGDTLTVQGTILDIVDEAFDISSHIVPNITLPDTKRMLGDFVRLANECVAATVSSDTVNNRESLDILWKTLIWNNSLAKSNKLRMSSHFRPFCDELSSPADPKSSRNLRELNEFQARYIKFEYGTKRTLFKTRLGYLGSEPMICRAGDVVCMIEGAHIPFLLRPWDQSEGEVQGKWWKLVGEIYLQVPYLHTGVNEENPGHHWKSLVAKGVMEDILIR